MPSTRCWLCDGRRCFGTACPLARSGPWRARRLGKEAAIGHGHELRTERLRLRRWREADRAPFAQMNADPEVMEHFPAPLTRRVSDLLVDRIEADFE